MKVGKVSRDELAAVGKLISTAEHAKVDQLEVNGTPVTVQSARDAFDQQNKKALAAQDSKLSHFVGKITAKADSAQEKLMRNVITRFIVQRVKPADDLVDLAKVKLHYADGKTEQVDLPVIDTAFNRTLHKAAMISGVTGILPWASAVAYGGTALIVAIAAGIAKVSGNHDTAKMLWHVAESNVYRLLGTAIPIAGHLVEMLVIAQEAKAELQLTRPVTVNDMLSLKATPTPT
jgi:hypothetical protein